VTEARFRELMEAVVGLNVLVIGDVMLDRYIEGTADRISPEAPVPVISVTREWEAAGGAANVAANVKAWGARCHLVGVIGEDSAGDVLEETLLNLGVTPSFVRSSKRPTTVKTRVLAQGQQIVRVDREVADSLSDATEAAVLAVTLDCLETMDVVILEDYDKGVLSPGLVRRVLSEVPENSLSLVDPKYRNFFGYDGVTVFKPNAKELAEAFGEGIHPHDPDWMAKSRARIGCEHLLLTLGAGGMTLASASGDVQHFPAVARSVYDVSGAGDTVSAAMAIGLAAGATSSEAVLLATHAAGVCVGKAGVATITPEETWRSIVGV